MVSLVSPLTSGVTTAASSVASSLLNDVTSFVSQDPSSTVNTMSNFKTAGTVMLASLLGSGAALPSLSLRETGSDSSYSTGVSTHLDCNVEAIAPIFASNADLKVTYATPIAANGSFGGVPGDGTTPGGANATGLPALCAVQINVKSSAESAFNFAVFLPDTTWNERFITTGNGGFTGGITWGDMGRFSKYGFASMSTDTGHIGQGDGSWGLNRPETTIDWGYRAMHGSIVHAEELIKGYYAPGSPDGIKYSYYASCSTGGRQGLREVQLHPDSFDGISVGAPAWWSPHLSAATLWSGLLNYPNSDVKHIPSNLFSVIQAEMTKQCDPQDGVVDNIVSDPEGCNFDFEALLCKSSNATNCLTPAQLVPIYKFYNDWVDEGQTFVFPGISLGANPAFLMSAVNSLGSGFYQNLVYNDTNWDFTKFSYKDVLEADRINPGNATANDFAAIGRYHEQGGKIIMYHGEADMLIPTRQSLYFYKKVQQTLEPLGVNLDDFFRFFLVPGMGHCSGSANVPSGATGAAADAGAPWYFSGGSQTLNPAGTKGVPGFEDADHDVILALMKWVEGDKAPERLIATKFQNDSDTGKVLRQRPLCLYPKQAVLKAGEDKDKAESWECKGLY